VDFLADLEEEIGWRFMGQRFTLDGYIFQNLVFDAVKPVGTEQRDLPTGLDILAVLGSEAALQAVEEQGATRFPNYLDQLAMLQDVAADQTEEQWLSRSYDAWLYAFLPVLQPKDETYPAYTQTPAWAYREMNTVLGSWTELKHDTILYSKMPDFFGGGGPPCTSSAAAGYVEPNPEAFYRMAYIAESIGLGLIERGLAEPVGEGGIPDSDTLSGLAAWMMLLGEHLNQLGEIADRELIGEGPTQDDYQVIHRCLGVTECSANTTKFVSWSDDHIDPVPVIAAVAGGKSGVLEAATGFVDRIYVAVPINGQILVAQGGVYSYYEFTQPRDARLTDEEWRNRLTGSQPPELASWSSKFILPGGESVTLMGFHLGAAFEITEEGDKLNLRSTPGLGSQILTQLQWRDFVIVIDGPVQTDGYTWWKLNICGTETTGWAVEEPTWYDYVWY
jgi:hypothetical protein